MQKMSFCKISSARHAVNGNHIVTMEHLERAFGDRSPAAALTCHFVYLAVGDVAHYKLFYAYRHAYGTEKRSIAAIPASAVASGDV